MRVLRNPLGSSEPSKAPKPKRKAGRDKNPNALIGRHHTHRRIAEQTQIPPLPQLAPTPEQVTVDMMERELLDLNLIVAQAMLGGLGKRRASLLIKKEHGKRWDHEIIWQALNRVSDQWESDFSETIEKKRASACERCREDMARERAKDNPSLQALRGHEDLLARLEGTLRPVRVEVDVMASLKVSLAAVIVDLSEDERDAIVVEQLELESLAAMRRLPSPQAAE